ncbi:hypothetical protein J6590_026113 [Homalodisca vitripennis]|nr:hypothetical protein J6590_026113 [Homalodisca vitripennis]
MPVQWVRRTGSARDKADNVGPPHGIKQITMFIRENVEGSERILLAGSSRSEPKIQYSESSLPRLKTKHPGTSLFPKKLYMLPLTIPSLYNIFETSFMMEMENVPYTHCNSSSERKPTARPTLLILTGPNATLANSVDWS